MDGTGFDHRPLQVYVQRIEVFYTGLCDYMIHRLSGFFIFCERTVTSFGISLHCSIFNRVLSYVPCDREFDKEGSVEVQTRRTESQDRISY